MKRVVLTAFVFFFGFHAKAQIFNFVPSPEGLAAARVLIDRLPTFMGSSRLLCFRGDYFLGKYGPTSSETNRYFLVEGSLRSFPEAPEEAELSATKTPAYYSKRLILTLYEWRATDLDQHPELWGYALVPASVRNRISNRRTSLWCLQD